jgi:transketolase
MQLNYLKIPRQGPAVTQQRPRSAGAIRGAGGMRAFPEKGVSATLKELGTILQGHPEMLRTAGIEAYTGSLGQGLSVGCGMAMAGKIDKKDYKVYCILGGVDDGGFL